MIAQDENIGIAYYPGCLGFNRSEANHVWRCRFLPVSSQLSTKRFFRPFQLRIKESSSLHNSMEKSCNERHIEMLDYLEKFIHSYPGKEGEKYAWCLTRAHSLSLLLGVPKIGQIWPTTIAHETLKNLFHTDDHFLSFFRRNSKKLEDAFVFIMGDHGPRREGVGKTIILYLRTALFYLCSCLLHNCA